MKLKDKISSQFRLSKKPALKFGFPVSSDENANVEKESQRGIAIIIALMIITFMIGFVADIVLSSRVANQMSINIEEKSKADYLAKSGTNLARFMLLADWGLDLFMKNTAKQEISDGPGDIWGALNGLPMGAGEAKQMAQMQESFELSDVSDSKVLSQMDLLEGQFIIETTDEDSKININYLVKENLSKKNVYPMLVALFSCPAEKEFLDRKDLSPEKIAARIADYIDSDKRVKAGADYADEETPYADRTPKHSPKNLPLDSIDELKLIDGWDDDLHAVFSPYLTVFPIIKEYYGSLNAAALEKFSTVNINTSARGFLGCMFAEMDIDCKEKFALKFKKNIEEKSNLSDGKNIKDVLRDLACYEKNGETDKGNWFKANSSAFKVKVQGLVGDQVSEATSVVYRIDPEVMKKNKIEHALDLLYWKVR